GQISGRPQTQTTAEVVDHPHDLRHSCRRCLLVDIDRIVEFGAVEGVGEQGYRLRVRSLQQIS
ncbi:MAG: hypothetical protein WAW17_10995, partial [Rhodococcus sp. (in: high G+C Gram-positive bacteria)]|uniref:hypothetical protein n=1 Tax=Rhodococcus sp. TaxID=1831 RepID=UPI003BAE9C72